MANIFNLRKNASPLIINRRPKIITMSKKKKITNKYCKQFTIYLMLFITFDVISSIFTSDNRLKHKRRWRKKGDSLKLSQLLVSVQVVFNILRKCWRSHYAYRTHFYVRKCICYAHNHNNHHRRQQNDSDF